MNKEEYLLTCLMEECAEVQKECAKALRFGLDNAWSNKTKRELLTEELYDLQGIIVLLAKENIVHSVDYKNPSIEKKVQKVKKFMEESRNLGCLDT